MSNKMDEIDAILKYIVLFIKSRRIGLLGHAERMGNKK